MRASVLAIGVAVLSVLPLAAVDTVYLRGQVKMADGSAPGHSVDIEMSCKGADPVRMVTTDKKGVFNLKAERDDFNHIARALPTSAMAMSSSDSATSYTGPCVLVASMKGYDSSIINLGEFTIGKDMKLPDLVLQPKADKKQ
jgi:hypothetical protein